MKRAFFLLLALVSGIYGLLIGPLIPVPPLPFLDEATALAIFVFALRGLGFDIARWIPFIRSIKGAATKSGKNTPPPKTAEKPGPVIDV